MVRTQSYAAAFVAVASLHTAAGAEIAEIDMTHVASSQEYLSGKVHAQSMAAKTVSFFPELVSLQTHLTWDRHNGTRSSQQACWRVLSTLS